MRHRQSSPLARFRPDLPTLTSTSIQPLSKSVQNALCEISSLQVPSAPYGQRIDLIKLRVSPRYYLLDKDIPQPFALPKDRYFQASLAEVTKHIAMDEARKLILIGDKTRVKSFAWGSSKRTFKQALPTHTLDSKRFEGPILTLPNGTILRAGRAAAAVWVMDQLDTHGPKGDSLIGSELDIDEYDEELDMSPDTDTSSGTPRASHIFFSDEPTFEPNLWERLLNSSTVICAEDYSNSEGRRSCLAIDFKHNGKTVTVFKGHQDTVADFSTSAANPRVFLTACHDGYARFYDMRRPYPVMEFKAGHKYDCKSVALSHPDGILIIFTGTDDREQIKVWDVRASACMYELATGNNIVNSLSWDSKHNSLYAYTSCGHKSRSYAYREANIPQRKRTSHPNNIVQGSKLRCWPRQACHVEDHFEYAFDAGDDRVYRYAFKENPNRYVLPDYGKAKQESYIIDDGDDEDSETGMVVAPMSMAPMSMVPMIIKEPSVDNRSGSTTHDDEVDPFQDENNAPPSSLINTLPAELLIRIFELAHYLWWKTFFKKERADWPAVWDRSIRKQMHLGHPEILTHVCSLWRQIIVSSSTLWSHIDIFTLGHSPQLSLRRSSAFVARAQKQALTLRVRLRHGMHEPVSECAGMCNFCSSIAPKLKTLRIDNNAPSESTSIFSSIIRASLPRATPGVLTKLDIKDHSVRSISNYGGNIDGLTGWALPTAENLGISQHSLDNIVCPIESLRLSGYFFPWTSPAYRGLVELHLLCTRPQYGHRPFIQVAQLREMLLACSKLRILHININITEDIQPPLSPVTLNELEELNLRGLKRSLYDLLLPLLFPGRKPLQLTFQTPRDEPTILYCPALLAFFRRTNVTSLYIVNRHTSHQLLPLDVLLVDSPTNIHTLGFERFKIPVLESSQLDHLKALPRMQLSYLCVRKCMFHMGVLEKMAQIFQPVVLKHHELEFEDTLDGEGARAREEMDRVFPAVKWVRSTRGMELWDTWELEYFDEHHAAFRI
ncbi:hypothetical protein B0J17DRAFT_771518 [Rhizoctonia solani]|nr:hypothetical protein B0J17DRAFT_771518 [Rhizoctonia solani]